MRLIGRDHPSGVLRAEVERAAHSHGGLVLVAGEAGIGKTTLVTDAAHEARRQGALVLAGACWDSDTAPGYWPWVQVVRALRRAEESEAAAHPRLSALLGESTTDTTPETFPLYDAVASALVAVSLRRPVVVVLEDLHWADPASLRMLEFAAQHTWYERVLLVGTYRDVEVEADGHPLRPLMSPLLSRATAVTLTGLSAGEVGELMAATAGRAPDADLVAAVHQRTGGNPFYVEQAARLWQGGNPVTAVAPGVRDSLERRLSLLPAPVGELLTTAAVLGHEFHRQVLAATAALPVPHADRLLDQAAQARLVRALGGGRFAFAHDLVRETLYDSVADKEVRHAAVLDAVTGELTAHVSPTDLARHAHLAGDRLPAERAVALMIAAARDAGGRLAVEEAAGHYRRALERTSDPRVRMKLNLDLGLELFHCGAAEESAHHFTEAVALARTLDDPVGLARVALIRLRFATPDDESRELLRDAYAGLLGPPPDESEDVLARAVSVKVADLARSGQDDDALADGLWAAHDIAWGLGTAHKRLALTSELAVVARRTSDHSAESYAASLRWVALLELGDPRYRDQLQTFVAHADRWAMPRFTFASAVDQGIIAAFQGRFTEAEALMSRARALGLSQEHSGYGMMDVHLSWSPLVLQGRYAEADALDLSDHPYPDLLRGITAVERGDLEAARAHLAAYDPDDLRFQRLFEPLWQRFRAQYAHAAGDRALAAEMREVLAPHRGQWVVGLYGCDLSGPVDLYLGLVDLALGRCDEAVDELTAALRSAEAMRARPWAEVVRRHLAAATGTAGGTDATDATGGPAGEFRRDGDVWSLSYRGSTVRMPDSKGLRDLHVLLGNAGSPVPAVSLLDPEAVPSARLGGDPVLDEEAKAAYRRRLSVLDDEIDRAPTDERAAELDRERAALLEELRAAAGLAGRTRRLGDEAERARKTVTARIRDTLRKLAERHPELAAHLRDHVSTGSTCSYTGSEVFRL